MTHPRITAVSASGLNDASRIVAGSPGFLLTEDGQLAAGLAFWDLLQEATLSGLTPAASRNPTPPPTAHKAEAPSASSSSTASNAASERLTSPQGVDDETHLKAAHHPEDPHRLNADDEAYLNWLAEEGPKASFNNTLGLNGISPGWQPLLHHLSWLANSSGQGGAGGGYTGLRGSLGSAVDAWLAGDAMRGKTLRVTLQEGADLILKIHGGKVQAQLVGYEAGLVPLLQQTTRDLQTHLASKHLPVEAVTWRDESHSSSSQSSSEDDAGTSENNESPPASGAHS
ncbi:MAG: hypothetical protein U0003_01300 [Vampirovibrionales bacterium]